jgi:hypothetical protein
LPRRCLGEERVEVAVAEAFARLLENFGHNGEKVAREISVASAESPDLR